MENNDQQREADTVRHIARIRLVMSRHDLSFEQAAAVLQLSVLDDVRRWLARESGAEGD